MADKLNFAIVGGAGKMGSLVNQVLMERGENIVGIFDPKIESVKAKFDSLKVPYNQMYMSPDFGEGDKYLKGIDTAICFTDPDAGYETTKRILEAGVNAVVGTTAFYENPDGTLNKNMISELGKIALVNGVYFLPAANFCLGMHQLGKEIRENAEKYYSLGYRPIILEAHHIRKTKDVSGSGKQILGAPLVEVYGKKLWFDIERAIWPERNGEEYSNALLNAPFDDSVKGKSAEQIREQIAEAEAQNMIPLIAIRYGDIPGTHRVCLIAGSDVKNLDHIVKDRGVFARGAVNAAYIARDSLSPGYHDIKKII